MEICNKILHCYAIYCRKEMVKIFKCYLIPKKSYDTLSKGAFFFGQPCMFSPHLNFPRLAVFKILQFKVNNFPITLVLLFFQ